MASPAKYASQTDPRELELLKEKAFKATGDAEIVSTASEEAQVKELLRKKLFAATTRSFDWVAFFSCLAILLMGIEVESVTRAIVATKGENAGFHENTDFERILKALILVVVCCEIVCVIRHNRLVTLLTAVRKGVEFVHHHRVRRTRNLVIECLLLFLHVPFFYDQWFFMWTFRRYEGSWYGPWPQMTNTSHPFAWKVEVPYHMDMAAMFMFFRVYHIPRFVLYHSVLWDDATTNFAAMAQIEITSSIALRAVFARFGVSAIVFFLTVPFICLSFVFSNCERLVNELYNSQHHALWASFVSLTTVGYGTDEAHTACGRGASLLQILLGITGTSLLIAQIQNALHMTPQQQSVMKMIAMKKRNREIKDRAAVLIQQMWRGMAVIRARRKAAAKEQAQKREGAQSRRRSSEAAAQADQDAFMALATPSDGHEKRGGPLSGGVSVRTRKRLDQEAYYEKTRNELKALPAVFMASQALSRVKNSPLDFQTDFSTAMELEIRELKDMVRDLAYELQDSRETAAKDMLQMRTMMREMRKHVNSPQEAARARFQGAKPLPFLIATCSVSRKS